MILRRSIGDTEMYALLHGDVIKGRYNIANEGQSSCHKKGNFVCFFVDDYWWIDTKSHRFCITVDIPEDRLSFGEGIYYAAASMAKTHIWSGKRGNELYVLKEAYVKKYSIKDVVSFAIDDDTYNQETHDWVINRMKEQNVAIVDMPNKKLKQQKYRKLTVRCSNTKYKTSEQKEILSLLKEKFSEYYGEINFDCYCIQSNYYYNTVGEKIYYDGPVNSCSIDLYKETSRGVAFIDKSIHFRVNPTKKTIYHKKYYGSIEDWKPLS